MAVASGSGPVGFRLWVVSHPTAGFTAPPDGIARYVAATIAGRGILQVARKVWQPRPVMIGVLVLISYVPSFGLWLPNMVFGR